MVRLMDAADDLAPGALPASQEAASSDDAEVRSAETDTATDDHDGNADEADERLTPAQLQAFVRDAVVAVIPGLVRGEVAAAVDASHRVTQGQLDRMMAALETRLGSGDLALKAMTRYVKENDPVGYAEEEAKYQDEQRAAQDAAKDRENTALRAALQQQQTQQAQAAAADPLWDAVVRELGAKAQKAGIAWDSVAGKFPKELVAVDGDPSGVLGYRDAALREIEGAAAQAEKAAQPRARVDTARPTGSAGGRQELVNRSARGEMLSTAELAQVQAAMNEGVFPNLRR